jgi:putative chitinase
VSTPLQWQQRLNSFGYALAEDGDAGKATYGALFAYLGAKADRATDLGKAAAKHWPEFGITTSLRIAHFVAQAAHETGGFRYMRELWGPTAAQKGYEGRADLGNCVPGDGQKFLGRGIFQCTGRDNYQRYGQRCGIDLACSPQLAEAPDAAMHIACLYWQDHGLNGYADADDILAVSNGINRGNPKSTRLPNGFDDRRTMLAKARKILG